MKTAILYTTRHGTTEKVARTIAEGLCDSGEVDLVNLRFYRDQPLDRYDTVVLGTSIHMGRPDKAMQRYVTETKNKNALEARRVGLFLCCMHTDEGRRADQLEHAFPEYLRRHAEAITIAGGEFLTEKMGWLDRMIVKKVSGVAGNTEDLRGDDIVAFIEKMKK